MTMSNTTNNTLFASSTRTCCATLIIFILGTIIHNGGGVNAFSTTSFPSSSSSSLSMSAAAASSFLSTSRSFTRRNDFQTRTTIMTRSSSTGSSTAVASTTSIVDDKERTTSSTATSTSTTSNKFDQYQWEDQWIPVIWARDVPVNKPTKVTVFDRDYVVVRKEDSLEDSTYVGAMLDECPHKKASLSEGRIPLSLLGEDSNESYCYLQCAYHGWTFDTKDGTCVEIPQVEGRRTRDAKGNHSKDKSNGQAIPAMISQEMIWILPYIAENENSLMERALTIPPPPRIPELDMADENFKLQTPQIRDFYEVDWTVLLENIMDPDHGLFAHQFTPFDNYAASKDHPQTLDEEFVEIPSTGGVTYQVTSKVNAVEKMVARNVERGVVVDAAAVTSSDATKTTTTTTLLREEGKKEFLKSNEQPRVATTTYHTPYTVHMGRRDATTNKTSFMTAFWICPIGVGKSRFMAASISSKLPIQIPRWIAHLNVLNFLDQDTFLVATQSRRVLEFERQLLIKNKESDASKAMVPVRKQFYVYRSPTEKMGVKVGTFFDATLTRSPGRLKGMIHYPSMELLPPLTRENVLNRYEQHTKICSDSQSLVKKCQMVQKVCNIARWIPLFIKLLFLNMNVLPTSNTSSVVSNVLNGIIGKCRQPSFILVTWVMFTWIKRIASKLEREFYFKYTSQLRDRDMAKIPNVWADQIP